MEQSKSGKISSSRSTDDLRFSTVIDSAKPMFTVSLPYNYRKSKSVSLTTALNVVGKTLCPKYDSGIFGIKLFEQKCVVVFSPEFNQKVLEDSKTFVKLPDDSSVIDVLRLRCDSFTPAQLKLKNHYNTIIRQRFTKERILDCFVPIMIERTQSEMDEIATQIKSEKSGFVTVDIPEFFKRVVFSILSEIFFGMNLINHPKFNKLGKLLSGNTSSSSKGKIKAISQMKQKKRQKIMAKGLEEIIQERQAERTKVSENNDSNDKKITGEQEDILDILLNTSTILDPLNPEEIAPLQSTEAIVHSILSTLSLIHYSIVSTLSWLINFMCDYSLGYSNISQRLILEIDQLIGNNSSYEPIGDISNSVPTLTGMLKETQRLYTPVPGLSRKTSEKTTIGDYTIPAETTVIVSVTGTHVHPKYWDEPQRFNPSRFGSKAKNPIQPYSYIPWSGGFHYCNAGMEFSLIVGRVLIVKLLSTFGLTLSPHTNVKEDEDVLLYPSGLLVNFYARTKSTQQQQQQQTSASNENSPKTSMTTSGNEISPISILTKQKNEKAWAGLRTMIQQKEYQLFVVAGTRECAGKTYSMASWFCDKALEFNFKLGKSPYSPDEILPLLQSPESSNFMILGICLATYQGKPAPNSRQFIRWLEESNTSSAQPLLKHINYFVFGCGDSTWGSNYQRIPNFVDESLSILGANRICKMGEYDSSRDDLHEAYSRFYKNLAPRLMHSLPEIGNRKLRDVDSSALMGSTTIEPQMPSSALHMDFVGDLSDESIEPPESLPTAISVEKIYSCRVLKVSTKGSPPPEIKLSTSAKMLPTVDPLSETLFRSIEIQIEVLPELMNYLPGDSLLIYPQIPKSILYKFFSIFTDYDSDMIVQWNSTIPSRSNRNFHLPLNKPLTLHNIFTSLVDLTALPTRQFLMNISTIVQKPEDEAVLNDYATDIAKYQNWIKTNPGIRLLDVISTYRVKPSALGRLIEFLPLLQPRSYPICSNAKYHSNYISILVSDSLSHNPVVSYALQLYQKQKLNPSICVSLRSGEHLSYDLLKGNDCRPLLVITRGLSIAPFISLLFGAIADKINVKAVFLHCLHDSEPKKKFVLRRPLRRLQKSGVLQECHLFVPSKVIPMLNECHILLWNYLNNLNCKTYVGGWNGAMLVEVFESLLSVIQNNCTPLVYRGCREYSEAYIKQLRRNSRLEECWY